MEDIVVPVVGALALFIGLPWVILHYITKWKQAPRITPQDENLLDELYTLARRLEERVNTVERIVAADQPDFRPRPGPAAPGLAAPAAPAADWTAARDRRPDPRPYPSYPTDRRN